MKVMYLMILWFVMFVSAYANIDDTAITLIDNICISTYDNFDKIKLDDCGFLTDFGKPELPVIQRTYLIPLDEEVEEITYTINEKTIIQGNFNIYPAQPRIMMEEEIPFYEPDSEVYNSSAEYPVKKIRISTESYMMDYHLVTVEICPFAYLPKSHKLELINSLDYTIKLKSNNSTITRSMRISEKRNDMIRNRITNMVVNPEMINVFTGGALSVEQEQATMTTLDLRSLPSLEASIPEYVIITNDNLKSTFSSLADWKTSKGVPTAIITTEEISSNYHGCDLQEKIRNYIKDVHLYWGAGLYILLGGDSDIIPGRRSIVHNYTDLYYSTTSGNWNADGDHLFGTGQPGVDLDLSPDFILGRAPVETIDETTIFIDKILTYELLNDSSINTSYVENILLCGATFDDNANSNNPRPYGQICQESASDQLPNNINAHKMYDDYNGIYSYDELLSFENFHTAIENGNDSYGRYHIISHFDHGSPYCIGTSSIIQGETIDRGDIELMNQNTPHKSYNIMFNNSCYPANFELDCFAERWINNPNGVGLAYIGYSSTGPAEEANYKFKEFFESIYNRELHPEGHHLGIAFEHCSHYSQSDFSSAASMYLILLGDPELPVWTNIPEEFNLNHPSFAEVGQNSFIIEGLPEGVTTTICLQYSDLYFVKETNNSSCSLNFNINDIIENENIILTITGQDYIPYTADITIDETLNSHLYISEVIVNDNVIGDNDGKVDAGETVRLQIELTNSGHIDLMGITMVLNIDSQYEDYVMINNETVSTISLVAGSSCLLEEAFEIQVLPIIPSDPIIIGQEIVDYRNISFQVDIGDNNGLVLQDDFQIHIHKPEINIATIHINDNLQIGENFIQFELVNLGDDVARDLVLNLSSESGFVSDISIDQLSLVELVEGSAEFCLNSFQIDILNLPDLDDSDPIFCTLTVVDSYERIWASSFNLNDIPIPIDATQISFVSNENSISLFWKEHLLSYNHNYNIYRSDTSEGPYEKLNVVPIVNTCYFMDDALDTFSCYYYKISNISENAFESLAVPEAGFKAWTPIPLKEGWPLSSGQGTQIHGSMIVADVVGDSNKEIFSTSTSNGNGCIMAFNATFDNGPTLFDIDSNPTTIDVFAEVPHEIWASPAVADIDNDGVFEVVVATRNHNQNTNNHLYIYEVGDADNDNNPDLTSDIEIVKDVMRACVLEDLDGDSYYEIIFADESGSIHVYTYEGELLWSHDTSQNQSYSYGIPSVADLDNDGLKEIVLGTKDDGLHIWRNDGSPYQNDDSQIYTSIESFATAVTIADIDNDGNHELITAASNDNEANVYIFTQNSLNEYVIMNNWGAGNHVIPISSESNQPAVSVGNLDTDAELEVICADAGYLHTWKSSGIYANNFPVSVPGIEIKSSAVILADIDFDDDIELIFAEKNNFVHSYNIDGTVSIGFPIQIDDMVVASICIDDIDSDNKNEIIVGDYSGQVYVWETEGDANKIEWGSYRNSPRNIGFYNTPSNIEPWIITSHETINDRHIAVPVVIEDNASLTILGNASFSYDITVSEGGSLLVVNSETTKTLMNPNTKIRVYGELIASGGVLSSRKDSWSGIYCYGGGSVDISGASVIEHALTGVIAFNDNNLESTITINNSLIKDCIYGVAGSNADISIINESTFIDCRNAIYITGLCDVTIQNVNFNIPSNGIGISKRNNLINNSFHVEDCNFIGVSKENSIGVLYSNNNNEENNDFLFQNCSFDQLDTGFRYSSLAQLAYEITNCSFNNCNLGMDFLGNGAIKQVYNCSFIGNNIGAKMNYLEVIVSHCSFTDNIECGLDKYYTIPSGGGNYKSGGPILVRIPDVKYCDFTNNPIGIRLANTSQIIENCHFFPSNDIGIQGGDNSKTNIDCNAENVFNNNNIHLKLYEDSEFSADVNLFNGHNDFYDANYDISFSANYDNPTGDLNLNGNWWGYDYPETESGYEEYIDIDGIDYSPVITATYELMDPTANNPFYVVPEFRYEYALQAEVNGDVELALSYHRAILEDAFVDEMHFWEKCLDKVYVLTVSNKLNLAELITFLSTFKENIPSFVSSSDENYLIKITDDYIKKIFIDKYQYQEAADILVERIVNPYSEVDAIFAQMELETLYIISGIGSSKNVIKTKQDYLLPINISDLNFKHKKHWNELDNLFNKSESNNIDIPAIPLLNNNYPNPFNPSTTFSFSIPNKSDVELVLYNIKGQVVRNLLKSKLDRGNHTLLWHGKNNNGKQVASGVYLYRLKVNNKRTSVKKCLLMK